MSAMASQITSLTIVYLSLYSRHRSKKHQNTASLASVRGIHRWPVNSPHKGPVTRKMFQIDDVIRKLKMWSIKYRPLYLGLFVGSFANLRCKAISGRVKGHRDLLWNFRTMKTLYHSGKLPKSRSFKAQFHCKCKKKCTQVFRVFIEMFCSEPSWELSGWLVEKK